MRMHAQQPSVQRQEWSAVTEALFAQGLMPSVWTRMAGRALVLSSLGVEMKTVKDTGD